MFLKIFPLVKDLSWCAVCGTNLNPLLLRKKFRVVAVLPSGEWLWLGGGCLLVSLFSASLSVSVLCFYPLLWRLCSFVFQIPFRGNYSICKYSFVVSIGGSKFRISLHCYLQPNCRNCLLLELFRLETCVHR